VVLVFPGALGDLLLLVPAVATLIQRGVAVDLSVDAALGTLAGAVLGCPLGPPADGRAMSSLFTDELDPAIEHWWRGAVRLHVWFGAAAAMAVTAHARALGIPSADTHRVERDDRPADDGRLPLHASASYAAALGVAPPLTRPRLHCHDVASSRAWTGRVSRRLVIHPGAGHVSKRWCRRGFLAVADTWRRSGGDVVVLLGPAEDHETDAWRREGVTVVGGLDLLATATLLASAHAFVGNDSGVSHLAGVVGCRGVVLFGPTRPERWRPLGGAIAVVRYAGRGYADVAAEVVRALRDRAA